MGNKLVEMLVAGLKFSGDDVKKIANDETYVTPAVILLLLDFLLEAGIAFFKGPGGNSGMARMGLTGFAAALGQGGSAVIGTFIGAYIMVYVLRLFKAESTYTGILRVYGSAIVWTLLGAILGLFLGGGIGMVIGIGAWLAYNFAVLFGLTGYTGIKLWKSFLAIVLTFIGVFILTILYSMIFKAFA